MKKFIFLTVLAIFALVSCSEQQTVNNPQPSVAPQSQETQKQEKTHQTTEAAQPEKVEQTEKAIIIEGLQWSEKASKTMNWGEAVIYCENLNEDDHNDWRLPNIDELRTLIKNCQGSQSGTSCAVSDPNHLASNDMSDDCHCEDKENNGGYYSKLGDDDKVWLWSSSTLSGNSGSAYSYSFAWGVNFKGMLVTNRYKASETNENYVRCVRNLSHSNSKKTAKKSAGSNNKKETTETEKLQWSEKSADVMNWHKAKQYCENLTENDHKDWRLPTISELRTLIINCPSTQTGGECKVTDSCLSSYCFNDLICSGCDAFYNDDRSGIHSKLGDMIDSFWSSSVVSDHPEGAWFVSFGRREVDATHIDEDARVRCVR